MLRTDLLQENIKPSKYGHVIIGLAQSSAVAILVVVYTLDDDDDVIFSLVVTSIRVVCESEAEFLFDEGVSVTEVVGDDAVEPWREFKLTTQSSYTTQIDLIFRINPGQLNVEEYPSWGSRSVDCFEKLEQIGEGTYGYFLFFFLNCFFLIAWFYFFIWRERERERERERGVWRPRK